MNFVFPHGLGRLLGLGLLFSWAMSADLAAQSLQLGRLHGSVSDAARVPVVDAEVRVVERSSGATRSVMTGRDGSFRFGTLPEGRYDVAVEALGFVPALIRDVAVQVGPVSTVRVTLTPATGVVASVDTLGSRGSATDLGQWLVGRGYGDLVGQRRSGVDVSAFSTTSDAASVEGLPWRLGGALVDGANASMLAAPGGAGGDAAGLALPVRGLATAHVGGLGYDVEVAGSGVGLRGTSRRGGRLPGTAAIAEGGAGTLGAFAMASGPLQGDTAQAVIGADVQRVERDVVGALAGESPRRDDRASLFGRFDWQANERLVISARASGSHYTSRGVPERFGPAAAYGRDYEATQGQASLNVFGRLTKRLMHEWRVSADVATVAGDAQAEPRRDLATVVTTRGTLANGGFDEARTTPRVTGMLHADLGNHRLKAGFSAAAHRFDSRFVRDADGWFAYGDTGTAVAPGAWRRVEGTTAAGEHRMSESAFFVQDAWQLADGLSLLLGARLERARIPVGDVEPNGAWAAATALDNTAVDRTHGGLSPRVGLRWELGTDGAWVIEGGAGTYHDLPDPRDIAEALALDRGADVRYGVGTLPVGVVPDLLTAPVIGTTATLLAPEFTGPRTQRLSLGVAHRRAGWTASLGGVYRHSDFLARRRDLNLPAAPIGRDQYDRPLYGGLTLQGSALAVQPGSNRRFAGFDAVHALEASGFSSFWGITAGLERVVDRGLSLTAQYTYSRTTDNVPGFVGTRLSPFPDGLLGGDWAEGRSDLDVPHRALLALEWRPSDRLALGAIYRLRSGLPFTPGVRAGVDANGDGDWTNDPAVVAAAVPGLDAVLADHDCVRAGPGGFVERNACREDMVHGLDLRVSFDLARTAFGRLALVADALDVIAPPVGALDRALLLVDPAGSVVTDAATGVTTIPYVANPEFGRRTRASAPGVFWRIGLRITP